MIKVLLIGPLDPEEPKGDLRLLTGGETTYIRTLLKNPPKGVIYTHWSEALKKGQIEFLFLDKIVSLLVKLRILPISSGSFCINIKGDFDLVHAHSNSVKVVGVKGIPVVLSDSSSNFLFLRDYLNWSTQRIKVGYFLRKKLFRFLGIADPDTNLDRAAKLVVFSKFAKNVHLKLGAPREKIEVIYPGIGDVKVRAINKNKGSVSILFVGTWFERKGGPLLLEAFERLSEKYPNISLTIVGEIPRNFKVKILKLKVKIYDYVPRSRLMKEVFPKADIFVLVPTRAEGLGFVVIEAMSFGIASVVSKIYALAELVEDGKSGYVIKPNDVDNLTLALEKLIRNKSTRVKMGQISRKRFKEKFSVERSNAHLLEIYQGVLFGNR